MFKFPGPPLAPSSTYPSGPECAVGIWILGTRVQKLTVTCGTPNFLIIPSPLKSATSPTQNHGRANLPFTRTRLRQDSHRQRSDQKISSESQDGWLTWPAHSATTHCQLRGHSSENCGLPVGSRGWEQSCLGCSPGPRPY